MTDEKLQMKNNLESTISEQDDQLRHLQQNLDQTEQTLSQRQQQIGDLEAELTETQQKVVEQTQNLQQQEQQLQSFQDQLMKAFHKIRSDEALTEKAMRAMAIAITLLEEQQHVSADGQVQEPRLDDLDRRPQEQT